MVDLHLTKPLYWERFSDGSGSWTHSDARPPGEDLAAMRQGADRDPGTVPALWPHHAVALDDNWLSRHRHTWSVPPAFEAEHHALTLYGFHQQSVAEPMHRTGTGLGVAAHRFRASGRASETAVDRLFNAVATATTVTELAHHLRRLATQLRGARVPLDYRRLLEELTLWHFPAWQGRVRRRWGLDYYASRARQEQTDSNGADEDQPTTASP